MVVQVTTAPELAHGSSRFELLEYVGEGATSKVWRARDRTTGRMAALKVGRDSASRGVFAAEGERLALGFSPLLPELLDVGTLITSDGSPAPYLALSWVEGSPLDVRARRGVAERRAIALAVARDVGAALADLHAAGVAHGDVKPANVLLVTLPASKSGAQAYEARLVDLGLSTDADARAVTGGTPRYLPPESLAGENAGDARARDRFALGILLAEVLSPEVADDERPSERTRRDAFEAPFDALVSALLLPDPGARPRAAWIATVARRVLGTVESPEERADRNERAVRAAYLASRRTEIARTPHGVAPEVLVEGRAGQWLSSAVSLHAKVALISGSEQREPPADLRDADNLTRARWLVHLVGTPAASWPLQTLARASDAAWADGLSRLAQTSDPASFRFGDVERAILAEADGALSGVTSAAHGLPSPVLEFGGDAADDHDGAVALALALAAPAPSREAILAIERASTSKHEVPARLRLTAADALCRIGETGRALALLAGAAGADAYALRAEVARRAGDRARAESDAREALALAPGQDTALAVLARLRVDAGDAVGALDLLRSAEPSARLAEVRALAYTMRGDRASAEREVLVGEALATTDEARARLAGLRGFVAHTAGDVPAALAAYTRAAEHAARAGAVVEEATYRTGEAAASVDQGDLGRALASAERASLLWDDLGRPADAARALLARAAAFAAAGARTEAVDAAYDAQSRARELGDVRAYAYAQWAITDAVPAGDPAGAAAARAAYDALVSAKGERAPSDDVCLRARARLLRHVPGDVTDETMAWGDAVASREETLIAARLEWWGNRADRFLAGHGAGRAEVPVQGILQIAAKGAPIASRGPALAAAAELAAKLGDGGAHRALARAHADAARDLLALAPGDLRESVRSLSWRTRVRIDATAEAAVLPEQIGDIENIVRALGTRDRLRPLLEQVLDSLVLWTGVERGLLLLAAPDGRLIPRAARNLAREDLTGEQRSLSLSIAKRAIELGEPVVAVDAAGELSEMHASVHALRLRSVLAVPLIERGSTLGVVYLDDRVRRGAFGPKELAWVRLLGSLAAVAIRDAKDQILLRRAARRAGRAKLALAEELARRDAALDVAEKELARAKEARTTRFSYDAIVGKSEAVEEMLRLVDRVTASSVPVLLVGESGSGKELVARAVHANGARGSQTFVGENCAAIPEPLLESTLFGHVRGAFTGADRPRAGLFEVAHRGTLFLDEIGEMSLAMQTKLLRVLEEGHVRPLGSERGRAVDVRVIAATHRDLTQMVKDGRFREDLFYRLNVITVRVPPLRERTDDIPLLVRHFVGLYAADRTVRVSREAMAVLAACPWPGNIRQLQNEVRRALVLSDGTIEAEHLSAEVRDSGTESKRRTLGLNVRSRIDALETDLVTDALAKTRGNQTKAAELLGLSRFGLQKMIRRLEIKGY